MKRSAYEVKERNFRINLFETTYISSVSPLQQFIKKEEILCARIIRGTEGYFASRSDPDLQLHQVKCDGTRWTRVACFQVKT